MNELVKRRSMVPDSLLSRFSDVSNFFDDVAAYLEEDPFFRSFFTPAKGDRLGSLPKIDVKEADGSFTVVADVAGMSKDDIDIAVHDNHLVISGENRNEREDNEEGKWLYRELSHRKFRRVLPFNCKLDKDNVDASMTDGLLTITVPKCEDKSKLAVKVKIK